MTHKIKVQMFGNFRMDYNGAPFVAEKMHKESQFNRMMQALIHYSDCGIAKDKLEEIVIGERDIDAPHTALRVIVYKTKQKLAQLGLPGKNLIYLEGGIYYWTPDIEIEEDAAEFEKLYNEACALEKQMPQESESAETVCDERIKEIEDNMLEIKLRIFQFYNGSIGDIKQVWELDEEQLQDVFRIDNESDYGPVFVSILAKGTGSLNIISLHDRHSRRGHGFFLPGGERLVSSKGEEVFVYFEKGDMKPPLAVYFSGYRTQEGFEGYYMMRGFGCPFILVTDPRSEGGAFYLGDSEFEQMITDYVTDKLDELGLTKDELVLSGASMGTFGSLYYGSKLSPHALLLAKPLANMGNVARNERILRAGGFATSLDILMKNYDNLSDEAIEQLNNRMWDRFDSADWSHTKFIISYLYEDDYDPDGYPSILSHLKSSGVEVYGKGSHGRHTDNSANVMAWFKSQYNNLLHDDFSR